MEESGGTRTSAECQPVETVWEASADRDEAPQATTHTHTHAHMHTHTRTRARAHTHTHTRAHARTHAHTHTNKRTQSNRQAHPIARPHLLQKLLSRGSPPTASLLRLVWGGLWPSLSLSSLYPAGVGIRVGARTKGVQTGCNRNALTVKGASRGPPARQRPPFRACVKRSLPPSSVPPSSCPPPPLRATHARRSGAAARPEGSGTCRPFRPRSA